MQEAPAKNHFPDISNPGSRHPDHCWKQNGFLLQVPQNADPTNDCISAVDIKPLAFVKTSETSGVSARHRKIL
jgi:hypothetical protein